MDGWQRPGTGRLGPRSLLDLAVILMAVLVITGPLFPPFGLTPNRDSGVYLYAARHMLQGEALYRDVWDHKPPGVYLVDLAAVATGSPSWGIWLLAVVGVGAAVWLVWRELREVFGRLAAASGVGAGLLLLAIIFKGNLPEEYGLVLQAAALACFARLARGRSSHARLLAAVIGALGGLTVLLKPTVIGLWPAMLLTGLVTPGARSSARPGLGLVASALAGGGVVLAAAAAALLAAGVWPAFWSAVVDYNLVYASGGDRWARWLESLPRLGPGGFVALAGAVSLYILGAFAWRRVGRRLEPGTPADSGQALMRLSVVDLPIEALLAAGSGRLYLQYLTPWFPAVALLAGASAYAWTGWRLRTGREAWALAALLLALLGASGLTIVKASARRAEASQVRLAVEAISQATRSDSAVLIWGAETQVLVLADRPAPSRYAYLYPLLTAGYGTPGRLSEFAEDLRARPPAMIIDTSATNPVIPPLDSGRRAAWSSPDRQYEPPAGLESVIEWLMARYELRGVVGTWEIYAPVDP